MERYEVVDGNTILGSGSYGRVDKVRRKRDLKVSSSSSYQVVSSMTRLYPTCFAQVFACKTIVFDTKHKTRVKVDREVDILKILNHPNIVRYGDVHWGAQETKIYMEFCREESLGKLVE